MAFIMLTSCDISLGARLDLVYPLTRVRLVLSINLVLILVPKGNECSHRNWPLRGCVNRAGGIGLPLLGKQGKKIPFQAQLTCILRFSAYHFLSNILL